MGPVKSSALTMLAMFVTVVAPASARAEASFYELVTLDSPPDSSAVAKALNNSGLVVGKISTSLSTHVQPSTWNPDGKISLRLQTVFAEEYASAAAVNDTGEVAGSANTETAIVPFIWSKNGQRQRLSLSQGFNAGQALAINNAGTIVGYAAGTQGIRAVIWKNAGQPAAVLAAEDESRAFDINESGEVVGMVTAAGATRAALWSRDGQVRDLGALSGDVSSEAVAISNSGDVVGFSTASDGRTRAFLWTKKDGMQPLGFLDGGDRSRALDITENGTIVGTSTSSLGERAFVWTRQDGMKDLNTLIPFNGAIRLVEAYGINKKGQIIALGTDNLSDHDDEGPTRVYLLSPGAGKATR